MKILFYEPIMHDFNGNRVSRGKGQKKVLVVLPASTFGGAERIAMNIMAVQRLYDVQVLTHSVLEESFLKLGVSVHCFETFGCHRPYDLSLVNALRYARCISQVDRQIRADLVLAFMHNGTFFCSLGKLIYRWPSRLMGSIHGNVSAFFDSRRAHPNIWQKLVIRSCVSVPEIVITPSRGVKNDLIEAFGAKAKKIKVIYNGIDFNHVKDQAASGYLPLRKECPWIVSISRLGVQKDHKTLLKAFRKVRDHRNARLLIVGDGECRAAVEAEIRSLGLEHDVMLIGFQANPYVYLAQADVAVLSSFCEGFGVALVEAFVLGIAQVASACPSGPDELIENGVQGFLVPVSDWSQMGERILQLLEDESLRKKMGEAGQARAKNFKITEMVRRYEETFSDLLAN